MRESSPTVCGVLPEWRHPCGQVRVGAGALADSATAREIAAARGAAVRDRVAWVEREAVYRRSEAGGPQQMESRGLLAVSFTRRDSRAGDHDLHTHVAISHEVHAAEGP